MEWIDQALQTGEVPFGVSIDNRDATAYLMQNHTDYYEPMARLVKATKGRYQPPQHFLEELSHSHPPLAQDISHFVCHPGLNESLTLFSPEEGGKLLRLKNPVCRAWGNCYAESMKDRMGEEIHIYNNKHKVAIVEANLSDKKLSVQNIKYLIGREIKESQRHVSCALEGYDPFFLVGKAMGYFAECNQLRLEIPKHEQDMSQDVKDVVEMIHSSSISFFSPPINHELDERFRYDKERKVFVYDQSNA